MASPTKQTWNIRDSKRKKQGKKRKSLMNSRGTTKPTEELFKLVDKKD